MAVYKNETDAIIRAPGGGEWAIGEEKAAIPNRYLKSLCGLTLVADNPAPWETLHADTPTASLTGLEKYKQIHITNASGAVITFYVNGDETNVRAVLNNDKILIEQDYEITSMVVEGEGGGNAYIYGTL